MENYEELEGKEVEYHLGNGEIITLVVLNCDYDIGMTLALKEDKTDNWICLNGKLSPARKDFKGNGKLDMRLFNVLFPYCIEGIKKGKIEFKVYKSLQKSVHGEFYVGNLECAFNQ
jgi:hypothetical protein